jgi:hypothetical protein
MPNYSAHILLSITNRHLGLRSSGVGGLSPSSAPEFDFYVHVCHPRGALPAHWTCRMFSGLWGLVVVRASWPGHSTLIKKKKKVLPIESKTKEACKK